MTRRYAPLPLLALLASSAGCAPAPAASSEALPGAREVTAGYNVREGKAVYDHYCATCHGPDGHGDGFNAYNLDPKPRNLGEPELQKSRSDSDLAAVIRRGGATAGFSTAMPPWGRTLNERQIANLVAYLRTLAGEAGSEP